MPKPQIVNTVATTNLEQPIDLLEASKIKYTIFDKKIYDGRVVYLKTPSMHGKVTIFSSGKLISLGTKSPTEAEEDLQTTADILSEHGLIKTTRITAEIRNIIAILTLSERPEFEEIVKNYSVIYEPEQFPAIIMKLHYPNATMLIFNSGKIVIAGVKNLNELSKISDILERMVLKHN